MKATVTTAIEYGTDKPCQVGRIEYALGPHRYIALAFRLLEEPHAWSLTWVAVEGKDAVRLPEGIAPSSEMLEALAEVTA